MDVSYSMKNTLALFGCLLALSTIMAGNTLAESPYRSVNGDYVLEYPRDHGAHPEFETEWWYFTGHLKSRGEAEFRFGFELVFFRVGLKREQPSKSAWSTSSLYLAHFAVTDDKHSEFFSSERTNRGSFGDAGAETGTLKVWNGDWRATLHDGKISLSAAADGRDLSLVLTPATSVVLHGQNGLSRKGEASGQASYYASFPRLNGSGTLKTPRETLEISDASVWMDQEFTSSENAHRKIAWDWFAIQFESGDSLMIYQLRDEHQEKTEFSAGTFISREGGVDHLAASDFSIEPLSRWTSTRSKISYPGSWRIKVPKFSRELTISPTVKDQELVTEGSTGVSYWEGRAKVQENGANSGRAYVELVGYK